MYNSHTCIYGFSSFLQQVKSTPFNVILFREKNCSIKRGKFLQYTYLYFIGLLNSMSINVHEEQEIQGHYIEFLDFDHYAFFGNIIMF